MRMNYRAWAAAPVLVALTLLSPVAEAACTFGPGAPSGGEMTLQTALNGLLNDAPDVVNDCLEDGSVPNGDARWVTVSPTSATILLEIAGFANQNRFGIYDASNPNSRVQIFSGPQGPGTTAAITFTAASGGGYNVTITIGTSSWSSSTPFMGTAFGFYLRTPQNNTFYSDSSLNQGQIDRMYAYRGNGASFISGPVTTDGNPANDLFGANDVILAYEDLVHGDNDYQDFVVLVRGVQPSVVPLPAAAWLFASALGGLGFASRRRRA
jgi:Domain of unknown function (DUF4114)